MNPDLERIARHLEKARASEEIFGDLGSPAEQAANLKNAYHRLAKQTHPDAYPERADQAAAAAAFQRLNEWHADALARLRAGVYGTPDVLHSLRVVLQAGRRSYILDNTYTSNPLYAIYPASFEQDGRRAAALVKIPLQASDNDLAENEARALQTLAAASEARKYANYLPRLLDTFYYEEDGVFRLVNTFEHGGGWHTLSEVRRAFPRGLDPKEVSWIWRRILVALGFAHRAGRIHAAVLPDNLQILPELHGLRLLEWSYSVAYDPASAESEACVAAIDPAYERWYPRELSGPDRRPPLPGADIYLAARCMVDLLGGDPLSGALPASVPAALRAFFKGCLLSAPRARPQDAWALKAEYEELIHALWGKLPFHPFVFHPINR